MWETFSRLFLGRNVLSLDFTSFNVLNGIFDYGGSGKIGFLIVGGYCVDINQILNPSSCQSFIQGIQFFRIASYLLILYSLARFFENLDNLSRRVAIVCAGDKSHAQQQVNQLELGSD